MTVAPGVFRCSPRTSSLLVDVIGTLRSTAPVVGATMTSRTIGLARVSELTPRARTGRALAADSSGSINTTPTT
jgi:hypothetical protein